MSSESFRCTTSANPEQPPSFRQRVLVSSALRCILDEVSHWRMRPLDISQTVAPQPGLIGLVEPESGRDPEEHVVVGPTTLSEFKHPLIADLRPLPPVTPLNALNEPTDLLWRPAALVPKSKSDEQTLTPESRNRSSCLSGRDDDTTHPPQPTLLVEIP